MSEATKLDRRSGRPAPDLADPAVRPPRLNDEVRVVRELGAGGMGSVWLAEHARFGRVAVKFLRWEEARGPRERLRREAQLTARVEHPHAVRIHERGEASDGAPFLVLELIEGQSLAARLRERGALALEDVCRLVAQVSSVLEAAHALQVLHRDVKPDNLMLVEGTPELFVKVVDFGIARALDGSETRMLTLPGEILGTPAYMAPEQLVDGRPASKLSDLWGLSVAAYEALTGERPFRGTGRAGVCAAQVLKRYERPSRVRSELSPSLDAFFDRAFAIEPEARFQSAAELAASFDDAAHGRSRAPAAPPRPTPLHIPARLFGREREISIVLDAFERASIGRSRVLFVTGYSGIGKTALVSAVEQTMVAAGAIFVSGKFDQFNRATPYDSLIQALRELIRARLLGGAELEPGALAGQSGSALIAVIPELEQLIGPQPPLEEVSAAESRNRFQTAVERLVSTLAKSGHPLVFFFDDLQWADLASIDLIVSLATDPESRHVLFVGAYRDNEIDAAHPLRAALERLAASPGTRETLALGPLDEDAVLDLVSATFPGASGRARLASVCHAKTHGNVFFLRRLLESLSEEGTLRFDHGTRAWTWDLPAIEARAVTEDVVEFVASEIRRMPREAGHAIAAAACIGDFFDLDALSVALGRGRGATLELLRPSLSSELVLPATEGVRLAGDLDVERTVFRFAHDRIRQAARSLMGDDDARVVHAAVGRHLLRTLGDAERERRLFELVDHLNVGVGEGAQAEERSRLRALNLAAARRAVSSAAFAPAHRYMMRGLALLSGDPWAEDFQETMALHVEGARSAYLGGDYATMRALVTLAVEHAHTPLERVLAREVELHALVAQQKLVEVVALATELVGELGFELPASPTSADVMRIVGETAARVATVTVDDLARMPLALDPNVIAALRIQNDTMSSAYLAAPNLLPIMGCNIVRMTLESGVCKESPYGFAILALVLSAGNAIDAAYAVGKLATELLGRVEDRSVQPRTLHVVTSFVRPFVEPMRVSIDEARRVFRIGIDVGDFEYAGWALHTMVRDGLFGGLPLDELEPMCARSMAILEHHRQVAVTACQAPFAQLIENLRGRATNPSRLVGPSYDEQTQHELFVAIAYRGAAFVLGVIAGYARFLFRDLSGAREVLDACAEYADGAVATYNQVYFHQLRALALLGAVRAGGTDAERAEREVAPHLAQLRIWQRFSPASHDHRVRLVEAELARVRGEAGTDRLYDQAIALATEHAYLPEIAVGNELAYRYHDAAGHEMLAAAYFVAAIEAYERWGAQAKVTHLRTTGGRAH